MKITQELEYAASQGLQEDEALARGTEDKAREFVEKGAEVYSKV